MNDIATITRPIIITISFNKNNVSFPFKRKLPKYVMSIISDVYINEPIYLELTICFLVYGSELSKILA